ncbi:hypothetical protein LOTGIDRAFT_239413 [Lottia gigantea]|uniref:Uncharacterized protein n=1 Tax=Lottia gigantea TaxID=225164 RepID=V4C2A2_LOTGI|nr:hypothetical protein LOTGIDRAFT_239413 [Lottia gigantea]ESO95624.1 hypothetical protein LOTGIDRAFT_239413 [Lottia gigantea]
MEALRCKNAKDVAICILSSILLVLGETLSTNQIASSMTTIQSTTTIPLSKTPDFQSTISAYFTTSVIPSASHSISATSVSENLQSTANLSSSTSPIPKTSVKNTVTPNITPTSALVVDGANVSCSDIDNITDCKEYTGVNDRRLTTQEIIGIACGSAAFVLILAVIIGVCCAKKKQRLSGSKADLSTYWEDNVTLSYINGHIDLPRDYPDEMISLDNDSFLNSLDSMSFSNMWTAENAKHTNF